MNRTRQWGPIAAFAVLVAGYGWPTGASAQAHQRKVAPKSNSEIQYAVKIRPLVKKLCKCHSGSSAPAGISLAGYPTAASVVKGRDVWSKVEKNLNSMHMPPDGAAQPSPGERQSMIDWIDATLNGDCRLADVGRVTLHRLNRVEYDNTIRDLIGVDFHAADDFPSDDVGYGFDNIGDVLSMSPLLMEKYLAAAEQIVKKAIVVPGGMIKRLDPEKLASNGAADYLPNGDRILLSNGEVYAFIEFPYGGTYTVKAMAYGQQAGPEPTKMGFHIDRRMVDSVTVNAVEKSPQLYAIPMEVTAGRHKIGVSFLNDYYDPKAPNPRDRDRNLVVQYVELVGPMSAGGAVPDSHRRIIFTEPTPGSKATTARTVLRAFATRAFRRPATDVETERLGRIADLAMSQGASFERAVQLGVEAVLCSPNFLFRVEIDPGGASNQPHPIAPYELASRLSYFLWSTMPDDALIHAAADGSLGKPAILAAQIKRMLASPKSNALADNFAGQWLQLRKLAIVAPDTKRFPDFNDDLKASMRQETIRFFETIQREDRSVLDFLNGKFTYVNGPLAKHYGLPDFAGNEFRRVDLTGTDRGGLLSQASFLTVTSNPTRTSPVKRGKWILENILGTPPPPPPPGVAQLPEHEAFSAKTLRELMAQHRKNPACATCHNQMDPLGFSLENYDATGAWRTRDGDAAIDASGQLPDGTVFHGPKELTALLMAKKSLFVRCLSEKMLTYALGRGLESYDKCAVDQIVKTVAAKGYKFSALVDAVVQSDPFRKRRGEVASK